MLERKGWKIHRIWSTDWFKNRDREVQRLLNSVRQAAEVHRSIVTPLITPTKSLTPGSPICSARSRSREPAAEAARQEVVAEKAVKSLREELVEYRQTNIAPNFPDQTKGILRDEVLDRLVRFFPLTREEFYKAVPMNLRQHTDSQQMQYLDDILEIIDAYA